MTLLFADVEGSTRLLHSLGERFGSVRARLRELVRDAAARWNGHEVDWAGDGAFLAFSGARDAIGAAVDMQRAIAAEPWPPEGVFRMRIGLHTGEPELVDEGYVGVDVHVAARICAAGHGDQVVISQATREVAGDEPVSGAPFARSGAIGSRTFLRSRSSSCRSRATRGLSTPQDARRDELPRSTTGSSGGMRAGRVETLLDSPTCGS